MTEIQSRSLPSCLKAAALAVWVALPASQAGAEADRQPVVSPERWHQTPGPCLLALNQGVDAIAEYRSETGEVRLRAGSWLGHDGRYLLPPPEPGASVSLQSTTGQPVGPGQVALQVCPVELPKDAVDALVRAQDRRLAAYFGAPADGAEIEQAYHQVIGNLEAVSVMTPVVLPVLGLAHFETAAYFRGTARLAEAYVHYTRSAALFEQLDDPAALAASVNGQGLVAWRQGELDQAVAYFERAMAIQQARGDDFGVATIANNLGLIHARRNELAQAVGRYEAALSIFQGDLDLRRPVTGLDVPVHGQQPAAADVQSALNTLGNLALVLRQQGQVDLAERYWRNYMALEAHVPSPAVLARARLNFAQLLSARGRLDEALWQLTTALHQFEAAGEHPWRVEALTELAALYLRLGDPAGALAHARHAVSIELEDFAAAADAWLQFGRLLVIQGDDSAAVVALERAAELAARAGSVNRELRVAGDLARAHFLANPGPDALAGQREIRARYVELGRPIEAALALGRIGEKQFLLGELNAARDTLLQAAEELRAVDDPLAEFEALELLGQVLEQLDRSAAIEVNHRAIELAEGLRRSALPALRQAELFARLHSAYRRQVGALVDAGRPDEARALAAAARMQAMAMQETSGDDAGRGDLIEARADLLDRLHRARLDQRGGDDRAAAEARLLALQRELDGVETALQAMAQAERMAEPAWLAESSTDDWPDDVLRLSYFLLDDRLLLWISSREGSRLESLERPAELAAEVAALQDWLRHPRRALGFIQAQAERLGRDLLGAAAPDLAGKRLVLIEADDVLHGLPFGLLHWGNADEGRPLVETHALRMVGGGRSAAMDSGLRPPASAMLLLADPGWTDGQGTVAVLPEQSLLAGLLRDERLAELPGTRLEAEAIAARASGRMPLRLRTGPEASREFLLAGGLSDYRIVHLATHGLVDLQYPMLSSLLLASEAAAGPAFLRPSEIAGLRLQADLVVLSGCETGYGRILAGSGALSLARPFLSAGAAEVLASLWKIDDARTARFMDRFYFHLLEESLSPAEALAHTQRWVRRQPDTAHPYYWTGFVLLGTSGPST